MGLPAYVNIIYLATGFPVPQICNFHYHSSTDEEQSTKVPFYFYQKDTPATHFQYLKVI